MLVIYVPEVQLLFESGCLRRSWWFFHGSATAGAFPRLAQGLRMAWLRWSGKSSGLPAGTAESLPFADLHSHFEN